MGMPDAVGRADDRGVTEGAALPGLRPTRGNGASGEPGGGKAAVCMGRSRRAIMTGAVAAAAGLVTGLAAGGRPAAAAVGDPVTAGGSVTSDQATTVETTGVKQSRLLGKDSSSTDGGAGLRERHERRLRI